MSALFAEQMLVLFLILALGSWLGTLSVRRISLGTAGVLFVALVFGHFGLSVPKVIMDLGLLLFVYAVGLQAGMRFFRTFRSQGMRFVVIALVTVLAGALMTGIVALIWKLPFDLATGLYTGALTCTPALAAVIDSVNRLGIGNSASVSVGYGIAYPFSMVGVVLVVQLLPRLLRRDLAAEEARWREEQAREMPGIVARQYRITNPNVDGRLVSEIDLHRLSTVNLSRVRRADRVFAATATTRLQLEDIVMVVGQEVEVAKMSVLLGEPTEANMDVNSDVKSVDVYVSEPSLASKKLMDLKIFERYTVVITRIRRQGLEITPTGTATLEIGDSIRVVGESAAVEEFVRIVAGKPARADETQMVTFLVGLVLGVVLGNISVPLPNGLDLRLGNAGGVFLVGLVIGHFGRVGNFRLWVPPAARNITRELGLMLFLAGAGTNAGAQIFQVVEQHGWSLVAAGILISGFTVATGLALMIPIFRMTTLSTLGALCACMTNPPGLGAAQSEAETDLPTVSYASVYPAALIFKILLAQVLVEVLGKLL
ncbi:MAG TPA: TrkA C-terminal domain-containing protein [Anaerolineales bacterium]|jgi:putative transport protein